MLKGERVFKNNCFLALMEVNHNYDTKEDAISASINKKKKIENLIVNYINNIDKEDIISNIKNLTNTVELE